MDVSFADSLFSPGRDRRFHERKTCELHVDFDDFETCCHGIVTDISKGGAFIRTGEKKEPGRKMTLTIPYRNYSQYLVIKGWVSRIEPEGMGVLFEKRIKGGRL